LIFRKNELKLEQEYAFLSFLDISRHGVIMKFIALALLALTLVFTAPVARAQGMLSLGFGKMEAFDNDKPLDFRAEYRWGDPLLWQIKPFAGIEANNDGAAYALGGLYYDFGMTPHWYLTPSFGAGLWHDGDGPDLHHTIEFRTQLEVAYEFDNGHRVSAGLGHISNLSLAQPNPGTEILNLYWHVPVGWWSDGQ